MDFHLSRFISTALLCAAPVSGFAEDDTLSHHVAKTAAAAPTFAIGAVTATGLEEPQTVTVGTIHKNSNQPVGADAPWHIGSITKSFTATLVMQQVETGTLSLDEPIVSYLTDERDSMHPDWQALTLRQLLSHTGGLPKKPKIPAMFNRATTDLHATRKQVLGALWDEPLSSQTGEFLYSNVGYVLSGYVLETVTGKDWENLILENIAEPLQLRSLGFGAPSAADAPWGHRQFIAFKRPVPPSRKNADNPPWLGPAGTIHMNLADLARWGQAHIAACQGRSPDFLSAESCLEMQRPVSNRYGLGWVISEDDGVPIVWHNGSNTNWYAVLSLQPTEDRVIAVATNVFANNRIDDLMRTLFDKLPRD